MDIVYRCLVEGGIKRTYELLNECNELFIGIIKCWRLNERDYGGLEGVNKDDGGKKFGEDEVDTWRG
ncbi:histidine phosphatase family protein [Staphylococcus saprophyticus]|uniref:hypothetical protein n=1 Tax=Staphylococcus saprophyticus TaxID=29385 RepID=UPI0011A8A7BF|nr:hypothetical protein [Staphylococcus saprophyticus]